MRVNVVLVVAVLALTGCTAPGPTPTPTTPSLTPTQTPPTPLHQNASVEVVSIDGRWPIPENDARSLAREAFGSEPGSLIVGEASFGRAAGPIAAFDARAADLLGGLRDASTNATMAPPVAGSVYVTPQMRDAAGLKVGDDITLLTYAWPPAHVSAAFEMERVRPCDPAQRVAICSGPTSPNGEAVLLMQIAPGSTDLRFHPDVVELRTEDYPAQWNGTFVSPSGQQTPFSTGARDRANVTPPGVVEGPLEPGSWSIRFTLDVHGKRAPGAIAGFITYKTLGFSAFDIDLLRAGHAGEQTRQLLQNATRSEARVRVAGVISPAGAPSIAGAVAVLSLADARDLLRLGDGNVTALAVVARQGGDETLLAHAQEKDGPALRSLHPRAALPARSPPARNGTTLVWVPADIETRAGGRTLTVEGFPPIGAEDRIKEKPLAGAPPFLALPVDETAPPWMLVPKAFWPNVTAAMAGMATGPHLILLSDDLAIEAGVDPTNATYAKTDLDGALGTRTVFGMGTVTGGPARVLWASAALLGASVRPGGARLIIHADELDATLTSVTGAALWLGP